MENSKLANVRLSLRSILGSDREINQGYGFEIGFYRHRAFIRRHKSLCFTALLAFSILYGFAFAILSSVLLIFLAAPLVVLLGLYLWVRPDGRALSRRKLATVLLVYYSGLLIWPDYLAIDLPGLPWITMARLVGIPTVALCLFTLSASTEMRGTVLSVFLANKAALLCSVLFLVSVLISLPFSASYVYAVQRLLVLCMALVAAFLLAVWVFTEKRNITRFFDFLVFISLAIIAVALYEVVYSKLPWAGRIIPLLQVQGENIQRLLAGGRRAADGIYRVQSRFSTSIGLGEYFGLTMPFILYSAARRTSFAWRFLCISLMLLGVIIVFKTGSRLAFNCLFLSTVCLVFSGAFYKWRSDKQNILAPLVLLSYPAAVLGIIVGSFFWRRLEVLFWGSGAAQFSTDSRKIQWAMGWPKIISQPWGHGIDTSGTVLGYFDAGGNMTVDSYYLSILLDFGFLGFIGFFGVFVVTIFGLLKVALRQSSIFCSPVVPLIITLTNFCISKSVYTQQENHPLAFSLLAISLVILWADREREGENETGVTAIG